MSRTYRNINKFTHLNEENYIHDRIKDLHVRYHYEWYWSTEGKLEYEEKLEKYNAAVKRFHNSMFLPVKPYAHDYMNRRRVLTEFNLDEEIKDARQRYRKYYRDGRWNETSLNSSFKHACDKDFRNKNRSMIHKVMHEKVDPDNVIFPDRKDGKQRVWDFW